MARILKPLVRGGGWYPSNKWIPLVKNGGYTTQNGGETEPVWATASGAIASFTTPFAYPLKSLVAQINPVQDLHGQSSPWPAGGGVNKWPFGDQSFTREKVLTFENDLPAGNYMFSALITSDITSGTCNVVVLDANGTAMSKYFEPNTGSRVASTQPFQASNPIHQIILRSAGSYPASEGLSATYKDIQFEAGSTVTAYHPYSNLCPISGHTGLSVFCEEQYDQSASPKATVSWQDEAGTVYGGTLDVVSGLLTVTHQLWTKNTATMNNSNDYPGWSNSGIKELIGAGYNNLFSNQIMNIGTAFAANTTGNLDILYFTKSLYGKTQDEWKALAIDVQIAVLLATPQTYQLTPQQVSTLLGQNNVWVDTGDVEVTYRES